MRLQEISSLGMEMKKGGFRIPNGFLLVSYWQYSESFPNMRRTKLNGATTSCALPSVKTLAFTDVCVCGGCQ